MKPKDLVGARVHFPVFWKGGEGNQSWVEQGWFRAGVCQVACDGTTKPHSHACWDKPISARQPCLELGSQSNGVCFLQVLAFPSSSAPLLA